MEAPSNKLQKLFDEWISRLDAYFERTGKIPRPALTQNQTCELEEKQISRWLSRMQQLFRKTKLPQVWEERLRHCKGMDDRMKTWEFRVDIDSELRPPALKSTARDAVCKVLQASVSLSGDASEVQSFARRILDNTGISQDTTEPLEAIASITKKAKETLSRIEDALSIAREAREQSEDTHAAKRPRIAISPPDWALDQVKVNLQRMRYSHQQRFNVSRNGSQTKRESLPKGLSFGLRWDRRSKCGISRWTLMDERHTNLCRLLCAFATRFRPNFKFTSVQVNSSFQCMLHVDSNNFGPSLAITVGSHTGGELWVHGEGKHNVYKTFVEFDGNIPHLTCPFEGERYCIIFYTTSGFESASDKDKQTLCGLGMPIPKPQMQRTDYASKAERLREAKAQLPLELRCCVCDGGDDATENDEADGDEVDEETEARAADAEDEHPNNPRFVFQQLLKKSNSCEIIDMDTTPAGVDMDEILRLSLEEYQEIQNDKQKEDEELEAALKLSSLEAETSHHSREASVLDVKDSAETKVLQQICDACNCCLAHARVSFNKAGGDVEKAILSLLESQTLD